MSPSTTRQLYQDTVVASALRKISGTRVLGSPSVLQSVQNMNTFLKLLKSPQPQRAGMDKNIMSLVEVTLSQPHAAYATFIHGISSRWTYQLDIEDLL